ncbi:MAG: hypothetical protein IEMM0002_1267 [bacterium]|nr:MAG: hypothetical protein IEMM0002_1267 [bacterium]
MNALIVFAKAPIEGEVKTRLVEKNGPLTKAEVCGLYRSFLCDVLQTAGNCDADRIIVNYLPAGSEAIMYELAKSAIPPEKLLLQPQSGENFAKRVAAAFDYAAGIGADSTVMVGSDSPTLQSKTINEAFKHLAKDSGAALGPSGEGGLYLIGLKKPLRPDFEKIFGEADELSNFVEQLANDSVPFSLLEEVTDVDVVSDLVTLISLVGAMKLAVNHRQLDFPRQSADAIKKLRLKIVRSNGTRDKVIIGGGR